MTLLARIKIWMNIVYSLIATWKGVKSNILGAKETTTLILAGKSLIRFGDGEFGIYKGKDIHYQKWNKALKNEFIKIKESFERDNINCPYILAVPQKYMQCESITLCKKRILASSWAESRLLFKKNFDRSLIYGDSFLFEKKNESIYDRLWDNKNDNRTIIFLHNNPIYAEQFAKRYNRKTIFIQCPSQNAFVAINDLEEKINSIITINTLSRDSVQLLISAGPAGKVLVYRFSYKGYSCIDTGHCWDDPLES